MVKTINGGDCGVALLAWGNLPEGDEVLKWKDVIMDTECRDFVLIKYRRDDLAGATHNFIQPQTVQVARILWRQKEKLLQKYNERELLDMPVIALQKNPKKPIVGVRREQPNLVHRKQPNLAHQKSPTTQIA